MDTLKSISPEFEQEVRAAMSVADADSEFLLGLKKSMLRNPPRHSIMTRSFFARPAWVGIFAVLAFIIVTVLVVGPQQVVAAVERILGYIPGIGIVEQNSSIRVLAEPVSLTRDGISLEITSAILTGEQTHIEYRIFGVPGSAYPDREDVVGCLERPYLMLPDGSRLEVDAPVPANVDAATYVMPCIFNTLPGTTPTGWELSLKFVAAPPDMTVMPVVELLPSPETNPTQNTEAPNRDSTSSPSAPEDTSVTVSKEIETEDGYILVGSFQPQVQPGERIEVTGTSLKDASGKEVPYTWPVDVEPDAQSAYAGGTGWAMQFKAYGLTYPLTINFSGVSVHEADPSATAEFTFDAGANPQPGQEWELNQDIQLAGHTFKLVSISVDSRSGYSFRFQGDEVYGASVQIEGFTPNGGGGGGGGGLTGGIFSRSLSYAQLPTGLLTVTISHLAVTGDPLTWQGQWTPANPRTDYPTPQPGMCLDGNSLSGLSHLPPELASGRALVYEQLEGSDRWGLVLYQLDDGSSQVVASGAAWGALSPDGSLVAYSPFSNSPVDIHLFDVNSQIVRTLSGFSGTGYHWSADSKQIAFVASDGGIFIVNADGTGLRQISDLNDATIAGWSPDGTQIIFVAPYTGGAAWKVYAYSFTSGTFEERFTIENGTAKFLNSKLSPDGNWIAYRGQDNSSLYLVRTDGSDTHLVADNAGVVGVEWTHSGWLGLSLRKVNSTESILVLMKPDGCEAYQTLIHLIGDLQGLSIP